MSNSQENNFIEARNAVNTVFPILEAAVGRSRIHNVSQMMKMALTQNDVNAFKPAFQEIFNIASNQVNNTQLLKAIEPHVGSVLRVAGINEMTILSAKPAVAAISRRRTTDSFLMTLLDAWIVIGTCIIAMFLIYWFFAKFLPWLCTWTYKSKPTPMQTPDWSRLWGAVHSPTIGPAYAIEKGKIPSDIRIEV